MQKRIGQIDAMKLICAFFVVTIHIVMAYRIQDGVISEHVLFGESFVRCCVPVFFMCSGYFLFSKDRSIKKIYKKLLLSLVLPTLATILFWFVFNDVIENQNTVLGCIKNIRLESFVQLLRGLLNWDYSMVQNGFYLWFMFALIKIYIAYPVIKLLCVDEPERNKIRRYVMVLLGIFEILFPTIESLTNNNLMLYGYSVFCDYSFLYIFLGYEFYLFFRKNDIRRSWSLYGLCAYIAGSLLTYFASVFIDIPYDGMFNELFSNYNSCFVFIASVGFFMFFRNMKFTNMKIDGIISFLGKRTFVLYLIHYMVIRVITCYGGMGFMIQRLPRPVFYVGAIVLCYALALVIAMILHGCTRVIGKLFLRALHETKNVFEKQNEKSV